MRRDSSFLRFGLGLALICGAAPAKGLRDGLVKSVEKREARASLQPILWDVDRQQALIDKKHAAKPSTETVVLLPHRVYLVYRAPERDWFYAVTDGAAAFSDPPEFLRSLSVFPGSYLGVSAPDRRYMLTTSGIWAQTRRPREEFYWVYPSGLVPEPRLKVVEYEPVATGPK